MRPTGEATGGAEATVSTVARWRQVDAIFTAAAKLESPAREALLETACDGDEGLRHEVEALLEADELAGGFLERTVAAEASRLGELAPGTRIGAYVVVALVGRGGMGTVYRALRADHRYEKEVAIKVLRAPSDGADVLRRFLRERQILASLEHPNIARLLDAATSEDGRPCIVMECVEGRPIDRYCEEEGLALDARLELFDQVCQAVQAAHRNLIVHRDLKPGNILVTREGIPKLLDFGIAKLLDPVADDESFTRTHLRLMTPEYASPEQVLGHPITTASDVYSLGVLLYRLLTGESPYGRGPSSPTSIARAICEQEPVKPSLVAARLGSDHARRLRGDLDTVVLEALRKEPARRYGSVDHLADDLRRHRQGLPIRARTPTLGYRLGKFFRRHRAATLLAGLAAVLLLVGALTTGWQAYLAQQARLRAENERVSAEAERARAEEVTAFLEELFQLSDPHNVPESGEVRARDLLDRGARRLTAKPWAQDETRARLLSTIGESYRGLGLYDEADPFLRQALELRRQVHGEVHPAVAESLDQLAGLLVIKAEYAAAEPLLRQALALRRRLLGAEHPSVAESLNNLAQTLYSAGRPDEAEPLLRQALEMKERLLGDEHPAVANGLNNLAGLLISRGELAEAETLFRRALELRRRSLGERHAAVAESFNNLGLVLYRQQRFAESEEALRASLTLRRELFGGDHPLVARSLGNLAALLLKREDFAAAEPMLRESLATKERSLGPGHPDLVPTLNSLGAVLSARGRETDAEAVYRRSLVLQRAVLPAGEQRLATAALALGQLLMGSGRREEAEPLLTEGLTIRRQLPTEDPRRAEAEAICAEIFFKEPARNSEPPDS